MNSKTIRVAVVDDQALFRQGIISLLNQVENISVVFEAANGSDLLTQLKTRQRNRPHIILMDLQMPVMDGILATKLVKENYPDIRVIVLTIFNGEELALHLISKGASAFLAKDSDIALIVKVIKAVRKNGYYFSRNISKAIQKSVVNVTDPDFCVEQLSSREKEVVKLICMQKNLKEIAAELNLSYRTIESHKASILEKTKAKNTAGIVIYALKHNLNEGLLFL